MIVSRKVLFSALLIAVLLVSACGGGGKSEAPAASDKPTAQEAIDATLNIAMGDLYFGDSSDNLTNPPVWTVESGQNVQLNFDNKGTLQHDWAIIKPGSTVPIPFIQEDNGDMVLWAAGLIDPATQKSETVTAPAPGEYLVICTVAGHYPSMQGKLIVK